MGYKFIGYSGLAIGAAARSIQLSLQTLKEEGTTSSLADSVMPLLERNRLLRLQSDEIQEGIIADMDVKGRIIRLEILAASELVAEPQNMIFESGGRAVAGVASSA